MSAIFAPLSGSRYIGDRLQAVGAVNLVRNRRGKRQKSAQCADVDDQYHRSHRSMFVGTWLALAACSGTHRVLTCDADGGCADEPLSARTLAAVRRRRTSPCDWRQVAVLVTGQRLRSTNLLRQMRCTPRWRLHPTPPLSSPLLSFCICSNVKQPSTDNDVILVA